MKTELEKDVAGKVTGEAGAEIVQPETAQAQRDYDALAQQVAEIRARAEEARQQAEMAGDDATRSTFEATAGFLKTQADSLAGSLADMQTRLDALKGQGVTAAAAEPAATVVSETVAKTEPPLEPVHEIPAPVVQEPTHPIPAPVMPAPAAPRTHTVVPGDSLSAISMKYFHTYNRWQEIYNLNRAVIGNDPNLILVGQVLTLPAD